MITNVPEVPQLDNGWKPLFMELQKRTHLLRAAAKKSLETSYIFFGFTIQNYLLGTFQTVQVSMFVILIIFKTDKKVILNILFLLHRKSSAIRTFYLFSFYAENSKDKY